MGKRELGEGVAAIAGIASEAMILVEDCRTIVVVNEAAERMFGWTGGQLRGKDLSVLMAERHRPSSRRLIAQLLAGQERSPSTRLPRPVILGLRRDGGEFPAEIGAARLEAGRAERCMVLVRDITGESAQREMEGRDDLLGMVAHDLRSPLHTAQLATALLLKCGDDADPLKRRQAAETIDRALRRAGGLIRDLLESGVKHAAELVTSVERTSPVQLLMEAVSAVRTQAEAAGIELVTDTVPSLAPVRADRDRVLQVFANLLDNAIKFTPPGGQIRLAAVARGAEVCFSVSDTGPGIPAEHIPRLFERFWQGQRGDARGIGLGLRIARDIVKGHGGRLWVESHAGAGSTFYFTLPFVWAPVGGPSTPSGRDSGVTGGQRRLPIPAWRRT